VKPDRFVLRKERWTKAASDLIERLDETCALATEALESMQQDGLLPLHMSLDVEFMRDREGASAPPQLWELWRVTGKSPFAYVPNGRTSQSLFILIRRYEAFLQNNSGVCEAELQWRGLGEAVGLLGTRFYEAAIYYLYDKLDIRRTVFSSSPLSIGKRLNGGERAALEKRFEAWVAKNREQLYWSKTEGKFRSRAGVLEGPDVAPLVHKALFRAIGQSPAIHQEGERGPANARIWGLP